ncbi:MAG TPA: COX15/CtaA family protein [Phycisphaerae bacterium]|nr:COX15/CtaA family protein [Phycisphaerae bacterium]
MADDAKPTRSGSGDILALAFGTTVATWAVGYVCRLPPPVVPSWVLLVLMLIALLAGGFAAGRYTNRGANGGVRVCMLASLLNLMILGSLLTGDRPNQFVPPALWWVPGSIVVAAVLGAIGGALGKKHPHHGSGEINWHVRFAGVLAVATLLLLIIGGLVTGAEAGLAVADWPNSFGYNMFLYPFSRMTGGVYYEHAHRLFGSLVGLTTLVLTVFLQRTEERRWLRRFAWVALLVVIVQGVLGGLRVTGRFTLSTSAQDTAPNIVLAMVHGTLGQVFFGMVVALAVFSSTSWRAPRTPTHRPSAGTDRTLNTVLVFLLIVQLVFGTVLRHVTGGLHLHISMAVLVILVAVNSGVRAWGLYTSQPLLQRLGRTLMLLVGVQVALGIAAYIAAETTADVQPRPRIDVLVTTVHQATGAIVLACAVMLMLWSYRLLTSQPAQGLTAPAAAEQA